MRKTETGERTMGSRLYATVLVTGGSGFLGRRIVSELQAQGVTVLAPRSREFDLESGAGVDTVFEAARRAGTPVEAVVHSAAYYGGIGINMTDPAGLITRNTRMTVTVFEAAARHGVRKVVSVGSACGYPGHLVDVMCEEDFFNGRCHDSVEAYGFNKRVHLVFGKAYRKQYGIEFNQIALTNLYGEHDVFSEERSHVIASLIKKFADAKLGLTGPPVLWGTGTPRREFAYAGDAARVIADALSWATDFEPVNLDGEEITIRDLAALVAEFVGYRGETAWDASKPDGVPRKRLSGEKLRGVVTFPFQPVPLRDGLKRTIDWYLANKAEADART
jgi:GDP-L-fucose synthase